jgi:hypothetical protein
VLAKGISVGAVELLALAEEDGGDGGD